MEHNNNPNPIQRKSSKLIYSPRVKPEHVLRLYRLKQVERMPMTAHVQLALEEYLTKKEETYNLGKEYTND